MVWRRTTTIKQIFLPSNRTERLSQQLKIKNFRSQTPRSSNATTWLKMILRFIENWCWHIIIISYSGARSSIAHNTSLPFSLFGCSCFFLLFTLVPTPRTHEIRGLKLAISQISAVRTRIFIWICNSVRSLFSSTHSRVGKRKFPLSKRKKEGRKHRVEWGKQSSSVPTLHLHKFISLATKLPKQHQQGFVVILAFHS